MDAHCTHLDVETEQLLLDDENIEHSCLKCHNTVLPIDIQNNLGHGKLMLQEANFDDPRTDSEDSPLLDNINGGCFREHHGDVEFHCHNAVSSSEDSKALKKLLMASGFCFVFMIAELVGGYLAGSLAVMTDAAHLFSDFIGFMISILAILLSKKSANKYMTFGYYRAEVIGAFLSVLTIWFLAGIFLILAIRRLYREEFDIDANAMILVSSIGLLVNIIMGAVLHGVCHTHSHGLPSESSDNINVRAAIAHVLGDLLQSVGVLLAAIIIKVFPNAKAADPICTLIFCVIVIFTTAQVGKDSVWLLMQGSPVARDRLVMELKKIAGVRHVHDLNIWALAPGRNIVTAHLAVDNYCDKDVVIQNATSSVKSQIPIFSCTIQVESYDLDSISGCTQCHIRQC